MGVLYKRGRYVRLLFVRANSIQLIAKGNQERARLGCVWPTFHVVYRDSVTEEQYSMLRSFAAQQILLHRSEETKKRFEP